MRKETRANGVIGVQVIQNSVIEIRRGPIRLVTHLTEVAGVMVDLAAPLSRMPMKQTGRKRKQIARNSTADLMQEFRHLTEAIEEIAVSVT
jgi:hypothetical protein